MRLQVHTINETLFDDEVRSITVPTEDGEITILENHLPIVTVVRPGDITVIDKSGSYATISFSSYGFLEVRPEQDGVILLAS